MNTWHKTSGRVIYDPDRGKMKARQGWWAIVTASPGIVDYYQWFLDRHWWEFEVCGRKRRYLQPAWGAHVSLCRGEVPANQEAWGKHKDLRVDWEYEHKIIPVRDHGFRDKFWMLRVRSPVLSSIREELGLKTHDDRGRPFEFHITIAKTEE